MHLFFFFFFLVVILLFCSQVAKAHNLATFAFWESAVTNLSFFFTSFLPSLSDSPFALGTLPCPLSLLYSFPSLLPSTLFLCVWSGEECFFSAFLCLLSSCLIFQLFLFVGVFLRNLPNIFSILSSSSSSHNTHVIAS